MTDTLGLLLAVRLHSAGVQDRDVAFELAQQAKQKYSSLQTVFADVAYAGPCADRIRHDLGLNVEISRRVDDRGYGAWQGPDIPRIVATSGFQPLPKRWVIERTHAWNDRPRRMAKDHDQRLDVAEGWIWFVQARRLLRALTDQAKPPK